MNLSLFMPPMAFAIVLVAVLGLALVMSRLAFKKRAGGAAGREPYACGENLPTHMIQPDYGQFFPFAFFFTILHVTALMVATVPFETPAIFTIAFLYIVGAGVGLVVLFSR